MTTAEDLVAHACDQYCYVKPGGDPEAKTAPSFTGTTFAPHRAVRSKDYPSTGALVSAPWPRGWPDEPPYCVTCGHEMLTLAETGPDGDLELHSDNSLEADVADET